MANKSVFNKKKVQQQIDFLNKNPHLKINDKGLNEKQLVKLYKKHFNHGKS